MSTTDRIAKHHKKWEALPLFPQGQWVASPDDVEAWSDLMHMRDLADEIEDRMTPLLDSANVGDQFAAARQVRAAEQFPHIELSFSEPWPHDHAADMLAVWRDGGDWQETQVLRALHGLPIYKPPAVDSAPARPRWWRRTLHKRNAKRLLAALAVAAIVIVGIGYATVPAKAAPGVGCETIRWGFLGSQRRTVCDTPRRADGSWTRAREVWVPAGWVPGYCSGSYWVSCSSGYYRERGTVGLRGVPGHRCDCPAG